MPKLEVAPEVKVQENPEKEITVQLDENNQPIKQEEKKEEPKYVTADVLNASLTEAIKKATAPLYYELRKSREPQQPVQPAIQPKPESHDELDLKLQKDWKGTIREMARQEAVEIRKQEVEQNRIEQQRQQTTQLLENNKMQVLKKHTELNDETSQKAELYRQVLQERPEYLSNPFGPVLAMRDMEDRLRDLGVVDNSTRQVVEKEVARQTRTNGGTIPKGSNVQNKNSVTLSKDQKEFCDANGIKYENFAKYSRMQTTSKEIEA